MIISFLKSTFLNLIVHPKEIDIFVTDITHNAQKAIENAWNLTKFIYDWQDSMEQAVENVNEYKTN